MIEIEHYFNILINKNGSNLHLKESQRAKIRLNGQLTEIDNQTLSRQHMINFISSIIPRNEWQEFEKKGDVDFAYAMPNGNRFRGNLYRHVNGIGAIFRLIPNKIFTKEELNLPACVLDFFKWHSGLVLVTGATGSGKSTTLATIIDHINTNFNYKIVTIENPVEFVHHKKRSIITHREVGNDTGSFANALRAAIKSNVDIILVGEMRDLETMELALNASEMGILVFSTLHTSSATKTVDRILDTFPNNRKNQIRTILANNLKAIVTQQLIPSVDLSRRYAAFEVLLRSQGLGHIIHSGETYRLISEIQTNRAMGMMLMDDSLMELVKAGKISKDQAYLRANEKSKFV